MLDTMATLSGFFEIADDALLEIEFHSFMYM
jgi:hypothetical protein